MESLRTDFLEIINARAEHDFTWSGLDSQEIVIFVRIMGPWGLKLNRNKIHNFL